MLYDYIIIGGGISGLYTYYQLLKKDPSLNIILFEKNDYFGGRIKTTYKKINSNEYQMEDGAGRFNKNHTLLFHLITELGLEKNIIKIDGKSTFIDVKNLFHEKEFQNKNSFDYIEIILKKAKKENKDVLMSLSFSEYASTILNKKQMNFMIQSSGYYGRLVKMNAYDAYRVFKNDIRDNIDYYTLKNGMSSIIKKLLVKIKEYRGKYRLNSEITDFDIKYNKNNDNMDNKNNDNKNNNNNKDNNKDDSNNKLFYIKINNKNQEKIYISKKILLCVPKSCLLSLSYFQNSYYKKLFNSIQTEPLCRIYNIYKEIWFTKIGKITTNNRLKYIIPINKKTGLIMISYTDNKNAKYWKNIQDKKNDLDTIIVKDVKKIFDIDISKSMYNHVCYWKDGTNYWKPSYNSTIISNKILQIDKSTPLFILGEAYSTNQGWVEGALRSSDIFLKL